MALPIPSVTGNLVEGGIGVLAQDNTSSHCKIGSSTLGTAGTIYSFMGSDTNNVINTLGVGPLVDSVIDSLIKSDGKLTYAYKVAPSTAGSSSAVTRVGTSPIVTLTGAPNDASETIIKIVLGGAVGTATFQYSLDNGDTYSAVYTTAATFLLPTGVTINFTAGTYVAGDTESYTDTSPAMTSADISTALDNVIASTIPISYVHIVGQAVDAASTLTIATMVDGKMLTAFTAKRPLWAIVEGPAVDKATMATSFASFVSKFTVIAGGFCEYGNIRTGGIDKRSSGRPISGRIARTPISIHPARLPDDSDLDPLAGVVKLVPTGAAASSGYHDENSTPLYTSIRCASLRSIPGRDGFFITQVPTMAPTGSNYERIQCLRIALRGMQVFNAWAAGNLSRRVRKDPKTFYIASSVADALEDNARKVLKAALGDHVDGITVTLNRNDNLQLDPTLRGQIRFVAPSFADSLSFDMGFAQALS